jgi:uncharacterized protein
MKLVLDSNVIIAAFATRGLCHSLLELCLYEHTIFLDANLLNEVSNKLRTKIKIPDQLLNEIISFLKSHAQIISPLPLGESVSRDRDDDKIISLAISAQSDFIISGDNDLLVLKRYQSIPILSPRDFWNILQQQREKFSK